MNGVGWLSLALSVGAMTFIVLQYVDSSRYLRRQASARSETAEHQKASGAA